MESTAIEITVVPNVVEPNGEEEITVVPNVVEPNGEEEITVVPNVVEPNGEEAVVTDVDGDGPVAEMRWRLDGTHSASYSVSRRRVPQSLIDIKLLSPNSFAPEMVSIGPFHHGEELLEFESCKRCFFNRLLSQTKRRDGADLQGALYEAVGRCENIARGFYDENVPMSRQDFIDMMVLDGCFIIELFRLPPDTVGDDPISTKPWLYPIITRDLLKLENQLPFTVLEELFKVIATATGVQDPLALLALKFFNISFPRSNDEVFKHPERLRHWDHCNHLLHLFHWSFLYGVQFKKHQLLPFQLIPPVLPGFLAFPKLPRLSPLPEQLPRLSPLPEQLPPLSPLPEQSEDHRVSRLRYWSVSIPIFCLRWSVSTIFCCYGWSIAILIFLCNVLFYCLWWSVSILTRFLSLTLPNSEEHRHLVLSIQSTTQLRLSGVKFKPHKTGSFLAINFTNGVLQIPPLTINDLTITVLINCLAYEQVSNTKDCWFTHYIAFLSCLINSSRDVTFLCAEGIIASYSHNDHYIAGLFSKLREKVYVDRNTHNYLYREFTAVGAYYNSHWGTFMRTYFSTPWSFISVVSAVILLLLTGSQTVLAVLSYIHQRGNQL